MTVRIKDNRRKWNQFLRGLMAVSNGPKAVVAGIQEGPTNDGVQVAEYAAANEFGAVIRRTSAAGPARATVIPSRPFMRLYFDNGEKRLSRFSENALTQAMLGRVNPYQAFSAIGLEMQNGIRKQILKSGDYVPNAPLTVALKGSDKPLIDDSIMINSVSYEVRRD